MELQTELVDVILEAVEVVTDPRPEVLDVVSGHDVG